MNGIINVLKPPMMTSQSVVSAVKRITGQPHVGHTGTLDPNAAGVLPVCIGKSTKLAEYLLADEKEYIGEVLFGVATDSYDTEGTVTETSTIIPTEDEVLAVLPSFLGEQTQIPPAFSAIKIAGKKAYDLARNNEDVEIPTRQVFIHEIELISHPTAERFIIHVKCSKGTYIRSIANDLGRKLGTVATLSMLVRTKCGVFTIDNSVSLDEIKATFDDGTIDKIMINPNSALDSMPFVEFPDECEKKLLCGNAHKLVQAKNRTDKQFEDNELIRIICKNELIALGKIVLGEEITVQPTKVIAE